MNIGQYEGLLHALNEIRDRLPVTPAPAAEPVDIDRGSLLGAPAQRGAYRALTTMLTVAKDWAQGSAENDVAMERPDRKPAGEQVFVLADIRNMVNDAARELGIEPPWK